MTKVYAPDRNFSGPGAGGAVFKDGVADVSSESALAYFRSAGYGIDRPPPEQLGPSANNADARLFAEPIHLGTPLRDAAVDPHRDDFLAPTNAGKADPHGPLVVAPGIHALPPAPIAPGDVPAETKAQDDKETAIAEAVLVEGKPATIVADPFESPVDEVRARVEGDETLEKAPGTSDQKDRAARAARSSSPRRSTKKR